jgi:lipopolysaccharide exporter
MTDATAPARSPHGGPAHTEGSLAVRARASLLWSALSFGSSRLIVFLVTLGLTRILLPEDFGVVAAGLTIIAFLEIALDLGVGAAVIYEQEEGLSARVRTAYTLNLVIAAGLTAVAVLSAPAVAAFFRSPGATTLFQVLFGYLLLRGASQVHTAVLQRDLRYRDRTVIDVTRAVVRGGVSVAMALADSGPWAIVIGMLVGELAGTILSWHYVRLRPTFRLQRSVVTALLTYGSAVLGLKVLSAVFTSGDDLAIGNRLGPAFLGLFTIASRLPELAVSSIFWIFSSVAFSLYAKAGRQGMPAFRATMVRVLRLVTLFGFTAGAGLAILAPLAVPVVFSAEWAPAIGATICLALAAGVSSVGYAFGDIFPAIGRPGILLRLTAETTLVGVVAFWFAAPYGITAVAAVHLLVELARCVLHLRLANRLIGSTWRQVGIVMAPAAATALATACCALPVSLLVPPTALGLALTIAAGSTGMLLALATVGRPAVHDLVAFLRSSR